MIIVRGSYGLDDLVLLGDMRVYWAVADGLFRTGNEGNMGVSGIDYGVLIEADLTSFVSTAVVALW